MWLCRVRVVGVACGARPFASLVVAPRRPKSRKLLVPSRENDPFLPLQPPHGAVVQPSDYHPAVETVARAVVAPRGDGMTVEKFLGTIGRGTQEHAGKFATWDALMTMRGADMKAAGIPVKARKWILAWVEHYKQGVEPRHLPIISRAKKNKFLSKKKVKTPLQKKRD